MGQAWRDTLKAPAYVKLKQEGYLSPEVLGQMKQRRKTWLKNALSLCINLKI